jgi:hypothetical protein
MSSQIRLSDPPLESTHRHRRESFWQIVFPIVLIALLFIGLAVTLYLTRGAQGVSIAADFALIFIILPFALIGLVVVIIIGAMIYGIHWALKKVPPYTNTAQRYTTMASRTVTNVLDQVTHYLVAVFAMLGGFSNMLEKLVNQNFAADQAAPEAAPKQETMRRE